MTAQGINAPATLTIGAIAAMAVIGLAALSAVLSVVAAHGTCSDAGVEAAPSGTAKRAVPANYLLYRLAAHDSGVPWTVLAAIGSLETDHGRSRAPGVRSGLNRHGCCAGPMQFNTRDGPRSTWQRYGTDANHDGATDVYDPEDAIPSAASYLDSAAHGVARKARMMPPPERCDDTALGPADFLSGEEVNVMIQTLGSLTGEAHRKRAAAASAWVGER